MIWVILDSKSTEAAGDVSLRSAPHAQNGVLKDAKGWYTISWEYFEPASNLRAGLFAELRIVLALVNDAVGAALRSLARSLTTAARDASC
jgi:hypothetical protein